MRLIRDKGKYHLQFNSDGEVNEKLPKTIIKALGKPAEEIVEANKEEITRREKKLRELKENQKTATEVQKENIGHNTNEQQKQLTNSKEKTKK